MNTNIPLMREGWICPVCGNVNAPWIASCLCNGQGPKIITSSTHYQEKGSGELYEGEFDER